MRVRLRRTMSGEWLHQDVPVTLELTEGLNGSNQARGVIPAAFDVLADDGLPMFLERGTTIYVDSDDDPDQIEFAGLCTFAAPDRGGRSVEFGGLLSLYDLIPYEWILAAWQPDPFVIVAHLIAVAHLTSPTGTLTTTVIPDGSAPGFVGDTQPPPRPVKPSRAPGQSRDDYQDAVFAWQQAVDDWEAAYGSLEPYRIAWWDHQYVGEEVRRLADAVGFDIREQSHWEGGGTLLDPHHELHLSPGAGAIRDDLALLEGVNLVGDIAPATQSGVYGNDMWVLGPGEGVAMRRGRATDLGDGRVRTTRFFEDKTTVDQSALDAKAALALSYSHASETLKSAKARANTLPGLRPGDWLPVETSLFTGLCRVKEVTRSTAGGVIELTFDTGDDT